MYDCFITVVTGCIRVSWYWKKDVFYWFYLVISDIILELFLILLAIYYSQNYSGIFYLYLGITLRTVFSLKFWLICSEWKTVLKVIIMYRSAYSNYKAVTCMSCVIGQCWFCGNTCDYAGSQCSILIVTHLRNFSIVLLGYLNILIDCIDFHSFQLHSKRSVLILRD